MLTMAPPKDVKDFDVITNRVAQGEPVRIPDEKMVVNFVVITEQQYNEFVKSQARQSALENLKSIQQDVQKAILQER